MFCESCGSRIPDGAKFCTQCGARVNEPVTETPEAVLPDIPEVILPDVPDIPDVILPNVPVIPDISQSISRGTEEPDTAEESAAPAWSTPSQSAASYEPAPAVPQATAAYQPSPAETAGPASSMWSIPGGTPAAPAANTFGTKTDVPKPLYKRWWFWLIIVLGIGLFVLLVIGALSVFSMRNTMPPIDNLPPEIESILTETEGLTDIDQIPAILENTVDIPDPGDEFPLDADDNYVPMELLLAQIDQELTDMDLEHEVSVDEDGWVFVDVWTDGVDGLAEAAYDGDTASLADWNALTENIRVMSEDFLADLLDGGQHSAVCAVSLLDDLDTDLILVMAIDGELILDLVTGIDEYGLLEE